MVLQIDHHAHDRWRHTVQHVSARTQNQGRASSTFTPLSSPYRPYPGPSKSNTLALISTFLTLSEEMSPRGNLEILRFTTISSSTPELEDDSERNSRNYATAGPALAPDIARSAHAYSSFTRSPIFPFAYSTSLYPVIFSTDPTPCHAHL